MINMYPGEYPTSMERFGMTLMSKDNFQVSQILMSIFDIVSGVKDFPKTDKPSILWRGRNGDALTSGATLKGLIEELPATENYRRKLLGKSCTGQSETGKDRDISGKPGWRCPPDFLLTELWDRS